MEVIQLKDMAKSTTQVRLGEMMGITQGAVGQMIKSNRDVRFVIEDKIVLEVYERKVLFKAS